MTDIYICTTKCIISHNSYVYVTDYYYLAHACSDIMELHRTYNIIVTVWLVYNFRGC